MIVATTQVLRAPRTTTSREHEEDCLVEDVKTSSWMAMNNEGNDMDEKEMIIFFGDEVLTGPQEYHPLLSVTVGGCWREQRRLLG